MMSSTTEKSVLICAKAFPPVVGGVESYSEHTAQAYLRCGVTPTVLTSFPGESGWTTRKYPEGKIDVLNVGTGSQPKVLARLARAARSQTRANRFTFCHATTWRAGVALLPWGRTPRTAVTVHGREILINPIYLRPVLRRALPRFDLVASVSDYTGARLQQEFPELQNSKGRIVSFNGLSYRREACLHTPSFDRSKVRIYSFCRLVERKNLLNAVRAIALLKDKRLPVPFEYVISGTGPLADEIRAAIDRLELHDHVRMTGYLPDSQVIENFKNTDIFLHPQVAAVSDLDIEGFGLVIADAMSFGAAAVVGKDGGPSDFIEDDQTGLIVDGGSVEQIAGALERLVSDEKYRQRIATQGRAWCLDNLSWDNHVLDIMKALEV